MKKNKSYQIPQHVTDIILQSISDGVFTVDHEWRITSFNQAAEKITGIKRDDALKSTEALTIMDALKRNNYNRLAAARELGMHKSTLFRKINKLGLKLPRVDGRSGRNGST